MSAASNLSSVIEGQLVVVPLEPAIGAEISGVDLSQPITDSIRDEIKRTLLKYKVVFFRDQELTAEQHAAFAARFGKLYTHPNTTRDEKIAQIDTSWRLVPTWGAVLRAKNLPPVGGDTVWVDAAAAYEGLSEEVKKRLEGLHVTHDFRPALNRVGLDYPIVAHPIVRTHPETGAKTLWVNFTQRPHVIGLDIAESQEVLRLVLAAYQKPEYQVRFSWRPNSVAFWDNRAAVHYAVRNYGDFPRVLERILIADELQYADL